MTKEIVKSEEESKETEEYQELYQGLTVNQTKALNALVSNATVEEASEACGLSKRTIYRYLQEPEFITAFYNAQGLLLTNAVRGLSVLSQAAVETIEDILNDESSKPHHRLKASEMIFSYLLKLRTAQTLERRVKELEERLGV